MKLVETINYLFEELFTINFSHSGFDAISESTVSDNLILLPAKETESLLKDYSMKCSFTNDSFVCYIRCRLLASPAPQPRGAYIIPLSNTRFRFFLKASSHFMNTTIIEPVADAHLYYFSNRVNIASAMFISHDAGEINNNDLANVPDIDPKESSLGVIDIFSDGAINNNYELFSGASGELRSPEYRLLFRSGI